MTSSAMATDARTWTAGCMGPNGALVSSDTDSTDYCVLEAPDIGRHRVVIRNYGSASNTYVITTEN